MTATHASTLNGNVHGEFRHPVLAIPDYLRWMLENLDGRRRFAWSVWRLPDGVSFPDVDLRAFPREYLQCAGTRERMTVEVRRQEEPGAYRQYTIGRSDGGDDEPLDQVITWDKHSATIRRSEVFDAAQAYPVFLAYYETDGIPGEYRLRELNLG